MKAFIGIIIAVVVLGAAYYYFAPETMNPEGNNNGSPAGTMPEGSEQPDNGLIGGDAAVNGEANLEIPEGGQLQEFAIDGTNFAYSVKDMNVSRGDVVRLVLTSSEGTHDFVIDELGVASERIEAGGQTVIQFTASEAGEFTYYCSVGNHREQGMVGTITISE
ncbi:MAG: plastocyanin/azurin family copper-binding protein [Patescibacteria group bacterium UBA2163]